MFGRFGLAALLALTPASLMAQDAPPAAAAPSAEAPAAPAPKPATARVILDTDAGPITLELETERAPVTAGNFLKYVDGKRLSGAAFYRAVKIAPGYGFIQGGVRNDPKRVLPNIAHEPTSQTGLSHVDGAISMARAEPGSANGDFFIVIGDLKAMDANPENQGDNLGFAVFGRVVEGMEAVQKIVEAPTSPTEGEGVMKGQMLAPVITITGARRAD